MVCVPCLVTCDYLCVCVWWRVAGKGGGGRSLCWLIAIYLHTSPLQTCSSTQICHIFLSWCDFASSPRWLGCLSVTRMLICNVHSGITLLARMAHNVRDSTQKGPGYLQSELRRSSAAIVSMSWDPAQRDAVQMCVHADLEPNVLEPWFRVTCPHIYEFHRQKPALPFVFSLLWLSFV